MSAADIYRIGFIDGASHAYALQAERIEKLEQLCRDLYRVLMCELICAEVPLEGNGTYQDMKQRMEQLGLLDGEQND